MYCTCFLSKPVVYCSAIVCCFKSYINKCPLIENVQSHFYPTLVQNEVPPVGLRSALCCSALMAGICFDDLFLNGKCCIELMLLFLHEMAPRLLEFWKKA